MPYSGVYCVKDGQVKLASTDLDAPNGLGLSPDEKTLYVNNWNDKRKVILRCDVNPDCILSNSRLFFDATRWRKDPFFGPDGFKVDRDGNIFGARPGGISVIAPDGTLLGTIETGQPTSNVAWGEDGSTLFVTGGSAVFQIRLTTKGANY